MSIMEEQFSMSMNNQMDRVKGEFSQMEQRLGEIARKFFSTRKTGKYFPRLTR